MIVRSTVLALEKFIKIPSVNLHFQKNLKYKLYVPCRMSSMESKLFLMQDLMFYYEFVKSIVHNTF